eukprot:CAMPEP_0179408798 /NCGR_PEP_ID=MMETSP0799-20121207/2313_1 /TAXON_ID=46947 /ORGANISM="Geminigera cryophila, Strain CCMP2564" /LENGTH=94 /DNA_ID=CAMNT_0021180339 /DNA_START=97 /DNA_END=378 /DNA_ORIENTATION=-
MIQMLISCGQSWASRQRQAATASPEEKDGDADTQEGGSVMVPRRVCVMVPCSLEELLSGCTKTVAGPVGTEEVFVIDVRAGWKDGTRVTFVGED